MLHLFLKGIRARLTNEEDSRQLIVTGTYISLSLVAFLMTILNYITDKGTLTIVTAAFGVLCLLNLLISSTGRCGRKLATILFAAEVILLFLYFLVSGNPDGFSAIWIVMLPPLGMLFFGRQKGSVISGIMFLILIFLLWTPYGSSLLLYPYLDTFRVRFPLLYILFYLVVLFLDTIQVMSFREMDRLQKLYRKQSLQDPLTKLFNRQGMYTTLENADVYENGLPLTAIMMDIDYFKRVNDTYGHIMGDEVLCGLAALISRKLDAVNCRWGGEEFVSLYQGDHINREVLEQFRCLVSESKFQSEGKTSRITISIGVAQRVCTSGHDLDRLIECADDALYQAKESGRNQIVYHSSHPLSGTSSQ